MGEWGLKRVQKKGDSWDRCASSRDFFCLSCSSRPNTKYFFLTVHYSISIPLSPSPSRPGRQPCWVSCLFVCVFGFCKQREDIGFRKLKEKHHSLRVITIYFYVHVCYILAACEKILKTCDILWECNSIRGIISVFITS
jgi:hypothetical protein